MSHPTALTKVSNFFEEQLFHYADQWESDLLEGDLLEVENQVHQFASTVFDKLMASLLTRTARKFCQQEKKTRTNVVERRQRVVLRTGKSVSVPSLYCKRIDEQHQGSRHLLANLWGLVHQATPARFGLLTYATMIAPSYEMAKDLLGQSGIACTTTGLRDLTTDVATTCAQYGEAELQLQAGESLAGKSVVISDDGGRTRTRLPNGLVNERGKEGYTTPWREPKLFVIEVLDDQGRLSQHHLPIYGCRFGDKEHVELLRSYLTKLDIHLAKEVQLVADGACWIWNQIPPMLEELGVPKDRLIQTLDYYHAVEHLNTLFANLPSRIGKKHAARLLKRCKEWLWKGKIEHILTLWRMLYKRKPKGVKTEMNYFAKHARRMEYATFKAQGLMCGSGVIESAIRRVINLRFKNTGTFWYAENVEQLYFLRGAVLSKRWKIVIENLAKRYS